MNELTTIVGGYEYGVRFDDSGKILATCCKNRWDWSNCSIGSEWIEKQLQNAVNNYLANRS